MSYIFTQTFKSTKEIKHHVVVLNSDQEAFDYAEQLMDSSVDITSVRVSKQIAFVRKVESKVWE